MSYSFGPFLLDAENYTLMRGREPLAVQPRVFDLIAYLVANHARVVRKEELLKNVWGGVVVSDASLTQAIMLARRALEVEGGHEYIQTVRGRGYRFAGDIRQGAAPVEAPRAVSEPPPAPPVTAATPARKAAERPLFGRTAEMATLHETASALMAGQGGVVLISGEPGSGKSRMLEEASRLAKRVFWGRCYAVEEGAPALWPWIQILRGLAREGSIGGTVPVEVAALVPELGSKREGEGLPLGLVDARFRLLDGVTRLLVEAAGRAPLMLLLDDLHLADELSLTLLRWVGLATQQAPLLLYGSFRQDAGELPEVSKLVRSVPTRGMRLAGLDAQALVAWSRSLSGAPASPQEISILLEQTSGNPFFVSLLLERDRDGRAGSGDLVAFIRNTGVAEAIRKHIEMLSAPVQSLLELASVLGPEFLLAPLCNLADVEPALALGLLGQAVELGILAEVPGRAGRYRFVHALLRAALYERLGLGRRSELHLRSARALAALRERGGGVTLAEISHHFAQSMPTAEAVDYTMRAAEEASEARLHEEATRLYERALTLLDAGRAEPAHRVEALLALGLATFRAGDVARAKALFEQGGSLARELGASDKLAEAALGYSLGDDLSSADHRQASLLQEGLAAVAGAGGASRALLMGRLALAPGSDSQENRRELAQQAVLMARSSGDQAAIAYTLRCLHDTMLTPEFLQERCAIALEQIDLARSAHHLEGEVRGLVGRIHGLLELSDMNSARICVERHAVIARELRQPAHLWQAVRYRALLALLAGAPEEAQRLFDELPQAAPEGPTLHLFIALRAEQGRLPELLPPLQREVSRSPARSLRRATLALALLRGGDITSAERELRQTTDAVLGQERDRDWLPSAALCAEVASGLPAPLPMEPLLSALRPYLDRQVVFGLGAACGGSVSYYAGLLARRLGHTAEARRMLEQACSHNLAIGASSFEARSRAALRALGGPA